MPLSVATCAMVLCNVGTVIVNIVGFFEGLWVMLSLLQSEMPHINFILLSFDVVNMDL
jgi:hypothetical protein